jgi:hypothetical protein
MAKVNWREYLQHHLGCGENPSPTTFWRLNYFMLELLIVLYFELFES